MMRKQAWGNQIWDKTVKAKEAADARPVMEELVTQRNRKRPVCPECVEQGRESGH